MEELYAQISREQQNLHLWQFLLSLLKKHNLYLGHFNQRIQYSFKKPAAGNGSK